MADKPRAINRTLFLIDGLGAILSTLGLIILCYREDLFGMPRRDLYVLIPIAVLFSIHSLGCYYAKPLNWKTNLKWISILNVAYCGLTLFFVLQNKNQLSYAGYAYFMLELTIIIALALVELRVATQNP